MNSVFYQIRSIAEKSNLLLLCQVKRKLYAPRSGVGNLRLFDHSVVALCGYEKISGNLPVCPYVHIY